MFQRVSAKYIIDKHHHVAKPIFYLNRISYICAVVFTSPCLLFKIPYCMRRSVPIFLFSRQRADFYVATITYTICKCNSQLKFIVKCKNFICIVIIFFSSLFSPYLPIHHNFSSIQYALICFLIT